MRDYEYADPVTGQEMKAYCCKPSGYAPDSKVVFLFQGATRNIWYVHRDEWKPIADDLRFMILAPSFNARAFPDRFDTGSLLGQPETASSTVDTRPIKPREAWTFSAIERIFDDYLRRDGYRTWKYILSGHSMGGPFPAPGPCSAGSARRTTTRGGVSRSSPDPSMPSAEGKPDRP